MLDELLPAPRLCELDHVDLGAAPAAVWALVRHGNLARSPLIKALFALRALPERLQGKHAEAEIRLDGLTSTPERPGFQVLAEEPGFEVVVGAIGKVWQSEIPFEHVPNAAAFRAFARPDFVKVAWAMRVVPRGEAACRLELEVRVDATDEAAWREFQRYFRVIGVGSHFIRHTLLASLSREFGTPDSRQNERALAGDELLPDAPVQVTHGITIAATPERIWPWLVQMGCRRAGFYSYDVLDNGGVPSARELHPELSQVEVGQVLPATPDGDDGFEVLRVEPARALVLGGLFDSAREVELPFSSERPQHYWQVTWAFVLEPSDAGHTRLSVRARAAFPPHARLRIPAVRAVHHFMQTAMLRHLAERAEGRLPRDDARDVLDGFAGAARIIAAFLTPFLRRERSHWGLTPELAARSLPGDELVANPRSSFSHGIEIEAPAEHVWGWIAQIGADRGGFYSYQWLENLLGCDIRNAEVVHPEWEAKVGQALVLHPGPKSPRLPIVEVQRGHYLLAFAGADERARALGEPWAAVSWLFLVEPLAKERCRLVSRYRSDCSEDLLTRLAQGPTLLAPIAYVMDRRMLLGVKERAEHAELTPPERHIA